MKRRRIRIIRRRAKIEAKRRAKNEAKIMKIVRIQSAQDARDYSLAGRAVFIAAARDFAPSPPLAGMDWDPAKSLLGIQNTRIQNTIIYYFYLAI